MRAPYQLLSVALLLVSTVSAAAPSASQFRQAKFNGLPYRYFEPPKAGAKHPVILYLHGEQEAGTDNQAQLTTTECATVWVEPDHLVAHPSFVIAPQIPRGATWTAEPTYSTTLALLDGFLKDHPSADVNRIYLVGFSMGATGVWNILLKNPQRFAAAMPISGSADAYLADYPAWAALKNTPVIIIHSYDDAIIPVTAALNAAAALQAGGNRFLGFGAPTPCLWSPGSTPAPHDAWFTAFHKFEVVYNSLFWGDLSATRNGTIDPTTLYTHRDLGNGIKQVWDYALGTSFVIERAGKALIVDTTMGRGSIYQYIRDNVLTNKDAPIEVLITHQHNDHILGLASFAGSPQLKKVYVHAEDSAPVRRLLGSDAAKVALVKDGDLIRIGDTDAEVVGAPGHSLGSILLKYENYLFTGDTIGTGYVGVGQIPVEQYIQSVQHVLDRMGKGKYTVYGGHTGECRGPLTEKYVTDLMQCARGMVNNTVSNIAYWRGGETSTRRVSTVGGSSITTTLANVRRTPAALRALRISPGALYQGYEPQFAQPEGAPATRGLGFSPTIGYYVVTVGDAVESLAITPTLTDAGAQTVTVNGAPATSGQAHPFRLARGNNRIQITVTAEPGLSRTYTLDVTRGQPR